MATAGAGMATAYETATFSDRKAATRGSAMNRRFEYANRLSLYLRLADPTGLDV